MKKKLFYSHLVTIDSLVVELDQLELTEDERNHLTGIAASSIHYSILDTALSGLSSEDKKTFMAHINANEHEEAWKFLEHRVNDIDKKIINRAQEAIKEFKKDIEELKKENQASPGK